MLERLVNFFVKRHLLTNLFFVMVFVGGIAAWHELPKEELPDITFDWARISVSYPGASAEEVEYYVTRPIEEAIRGLDGIRTVSSSTGSGHCSVSVELETRDSDRDEIVTEIRNTVLDVDLPDDIINDPHVRVWKTSHKAIIDIGLYHTGEHVLTVEGRRELQAAVYDLSNLLLSFREVSFVSKSDYLQDEINIRIKPEKLIEYDIPFNSIISTIRASNVRQPVGVIENEREPKVVVDGELTTAEELRDLSIQGGFEGQVVRLGDVADVEFGYQKSGRITKVNGHQGIFLNIRKSSSAGILEAVDKIREAVAEFAESNLKDSPIKIAVLDDESADVRNRMTIIAINGGIGFAMILFVLFVFLDARSGIWVALGIPFSLCFTLLAAFFMGYTVNNVTLAAVIIVMGMVVDDAIVVAENIMRTRSAGLDPQVAGAKGTAYVFLPIVASILTTCVAFIPLMFFAGKFSGMVTFIPIIVSIMLIGSLIEALFVLPGHMTLEAGDIRRALLGWVPIRRIRKRLRAMVPKPVRRGEHWFGRVEDFYGLVMQAVLKRSGVALAVFVAVLMVTFKLVGPQMDFVMFPDEETQQVNIIAEAPAGSTRFETAEAVQPVEDVLAEYLDAEVVGFRNYIARTRRGSAAKENEFRMRIEILSRDERDKSADDLITEWTNRISSIEGINKIRVSKIRGRHSEGSPIAVFVKENNDQVRRELSDELVVILEEHPSLKNAEVDRPKMSPEYRIAFDRDKLSRLDISPSTVSGTLRAALAGTSLYEFSGDDETIDVRLSTPEHAKTNIQQVLDIPVENKRGYLVPLRDIVTVLKTNSPSSITREDEKRITVVYADLEDEAEETPLQIADHFERDILPGLQQKYPSSIVEFRGEVLDTRESRKDFMTAIWMVLVFIYVILALLLNSLFKPLIIMLAIPFSVVGIILTFRLHGITQYGFFAMVGALGLAGVVVNDAIIMLVKLDKEFDSSAPPEELNRQVADIAKTRLRAVMLTTITTVVGMLPTAYGWAGYDAMLAQMMLAISWGLVFGTVITLIMIPCVYSLVKKVEQI